MSNAQQAYVILLAGGVMFCLVLALGTAGLLPGLAVMAWTQWKIGQSER